MKCVLRVLSTFNANIWLFALDSSYSLSSFRILPENLHRETSVNFFPLNLLDCVEVRCSGSHCHCHVQSLHFLRVSSWVLSGYAVLLPQSKDMQLETMAALNRP